jgi:DNA polymerase phi
MDPKHLGAVCDMYAALQKTYALDPKSKVHSSIFTEWTSWLAARKQHA